MSKNKMVYDFLPAEDVAACVADLSKENEYITETAGFIPLEVKFKQFEQNGFIAQFMTSDFDSNDLRDIYLNPDFNITPEDDLEDIQEKILAREEFANKIKAAKAASAGGAVPDEVRSGANAAEKTNESDSSTTEEVNA